MIHVEDAEEPSQSIPYVLHASKLYNTFVSNVVQNLKELYINAICI